MANQFQRIIFVDKGTGVFIGRYLGGTAGRIGYGLLQLVAGSIIRIFNTAFIMKRDAIREIKVVVMDAVYKFIVIKSQVAILVIPIIVYPRIFIMKPYRL